MVLKKKKSEETVNEFIAKGAQVKHKETEWTKICLRISQDLVDKIDTVVQRKIGYNRTTWILKTLDEAVKKED